MTAAITFVVRTLPGQALSSNAKNQRNRFAVSEAKGDLGHQSHISMLEQYGPDVPQFRGCRVDVLLLFYVKHHARPGDGLYRPLDPSNVGGECIKPVIDYGLVKTGVLEDDDWKHVRFVVVGIEPVDDLKDERIEVTVTEAEEREAA